MDGNELLKYINSAVFVVISDHMKTEGREHGPVKMGMVDMDQYGSLVASSDLRICY